MAWPYGIADPNIYAYIMNAAASLSAAQYPYTAMPNAATSPLNYYASVGLQRAAAAYSPYNLHSSLRPRADVLPTSSLLRPTLGTDPHTAAAAAAAAASSPAAGLHPAARDHPALLAHSQLLGHHSSTPCSAAAGEPCNCPLFYGALPPVSTSLPAPTPITPTPAPAVPPRTTAPSQPTLFQPYKTDVERAWWRHNNSHRTCVSGILLLMWFHNSQTLRQLL